MKLNAAKRTSIFSLFSLITISLVFSTAIFGQSAKFKKGDRVEVDVNRSSERLERKWMRAKVADVMMWNGEVSGVYVKLDDGREMTVEEKDLRLSTGAEPKTTQTDTAPNPSENAQTTANNNGEWKPIVDEDDTVLANRKLLDCPVEQPKTNAKARPPIELLKKIIRCSTERPATMKSSDGAVTMDITKFTVGAPRRWVANSDFGDGNANTIVYSIEVGYTMTKFYRSGNQIRENVWIYGCWVNNVGYWECGTNKRIKEGAVKNIP